MISTILIWEFRNVYHCVLILGPLFHGPGALEGSSTPTISNKLSHAAQLAKNTQKGVASSLQPITFCTCIIQR